MVPKGLKYSKKSKKSTDWANAGIQGTMLVLSLVNEATKFAPFPYLSQAAGTTLKIIDTIQSVKDHKIQFQRLGDDVAKIIAGIWKSYQEVPQNEKVDWPPVELRNVIEELVLTLNSILDFVEEQAQRSRVARVLNSLSDPGKIQEYREHLATAMSQFEMRSHLNINHVLNQLLKNQRATMQGQLATTAPMGEVTVNRPETTHIPESGEVIEEGEEKDGPLEGEHCRSAEEKTHFMEEEPPMPQTMEKVRVPEDRIPDGQAKELQRQERDRQQYDQPRIATEQVMELLRVREKATLAAAEKEREDKQAQKEGLVRMAAEDKEREDRRQAEERARVEAKEQLRSQEMERIHIAEQEAESQRLWEEMKAQLRQYTREQESRLAVERTLHEPKERKKKEVESEEHIAVIPGHWERQMANLETKGLQQPDNLYPEVNKARRTPRPSKAAGKMKARVQEEDDNRKVANKAETEESEKAARIAEQSRRASGKKNKNPKVNSTPAAVGTASSSINMGATPIHSPSSMPSMIQPSPFYPQQAFSYGYPYAPPYLVGPPMGMYPGPSHYGQSYAPPTTAAATNINSFNNSKISGGVTISNTTIGP